MSYILLGLFCLMLFGWGLGAVPLMGLDESLYAETAREMLTSGDYIVPRYNGQPFFDKPPLAYWMQAVSMAVFGVNSFAVRLPSMICGLILVATTVFLGTRLFGPREGIYSGYALASCILTTALARMSILDMPFAMAITVALGGFYLAHEKKIGKWGYTVFWAATGTSAMIKGPAGLVIIGAVLLVQLLLTRRIRDARNLLNLWGIVAFLAIVGPWYAAITIRTNGAFLQEFIIHQNLQRAAGNDFYHNMPFYYYVPVFLAGFIPWSGFVPLAWKTNIGAEDQRFRTFLKVWFVVIFVMFSLITSKLPAYIYPVYPAAAILTGQYWCSTETNGVRWCALAVLSFAIIFGIALQIAYTKLPEPIPGLATVLALMVGPLMVGAAAAVVFAYLKHKPAVFASLTAGITVFLLITVMQGMPIASQATDGLSRVIGDGIQRSTRLSHAVITYRAIPRLASLPFYARQPVREVNDAVSLRLEALRAGQGFVVANGEVPLPLTEAHRIADFGRFTVYWFAMNELDETQRQ